MVEMMEMNGNKHELELEKKEVTEKCQGKIPESGGQHAQMKYKEKIKIQLVKKKGDDRRYSRTRRRCPRRCARSMRPPTYRTDLGALTA